MNQFSLTYLKFPDFLTNFQNSLAFPRLEKVVSFFQVLQVEPPVLLQINSNSVAGLEGRHFSQKRIPVLPKFIYFMTNVQLLLRRINFPTESVQVPA